VCLIPDEAGNYRGNRCWACQFRIRCPMCMVECIPAQEGSEHGMGSLVAVDGGALHEECCTHDKELHDCLLLLMVQAGYYKPEWVEKRLGAWVRDLAS